MEKVENDVRKEKCPKGYPRIYCECDDKPEKCDGAWNCDEIEEIAIKVIAYYETNKDYAINPEDKIDTEHYKIMLNKCDFNDDGTIDTCEVHECVLDAENAYRKENCKNSGEMNCECPFYVVPCENAWNCSNVMFVSDEVMKAYDTNKDFSLDKSDKIDKEHLAIMMKFCDYSDDKKLDVCEVHDCLVMVENEWRADNCEFSEKLYCKCPFEKKTCEDSWTCDDIKDVVA